LLEGLHHQRQRRFDAARQALAAATGRDPGYAAAWAALASAAAYRAFLDGADPEESYGEAGRAVERALALDPDLAEAWSTRAQVRFFARGDLEGALADVDRAVALDPASGHAHYTRGALLIAADRPDAALAALDRSLAVDPLSPATRMMQGRAHLRRGDLAAALAVSRENAALHPQQGQLRGAVVRVLTLAGHHDEARREAELGDAGTLIAALLAGRRDEAERLLAAREAGWSDLAGGPRAASAAVALAFDRARLGDRDAALGWMEAAAGETGSRVALLQLLPDPEIDFLRDDPRFGRVLAAIDAAPSFAAASGAAPAADLAGPTAAPAPPPPAVEGRL
jgi:serine/threonine-protein kinase